MQSTNASYIGAGLLLFMSSVPGEADTVYTDNLIVIGNSCIGQDCSNGASFPSSPLMLSENNTRIAFGSSGDFRLAANSSLNGGRNEFRIDTLQTALRDDLQLNGLEVGDMIQVPSAIVQPDGSLLVSVDDFSSRISNRDSLGSDNSVEFTSGQTILLPFGDFTTIVSSFVRVDTAIPLVSTSPSGTFQASVTYAEEMVTFSDDGSLVTLGAGSEYVSSAVSVGGPAAPRKIQDIRDAEQTSDLASAGQLSSVGSQYGTTSAILNSGDTDVLAGVLGETVHLEHVSAMTAAMSALQPNPRGHSSFSLSFGIGEYEGQTAGAVGFLFDSTDNSTINLMLAGSEETEMQTSINFRVVW